MGLSKKSKKKNYSDKETQSPMIKVFKEMIQREKSDPEKAILIKKEKQENRKKKTYAGLNHKCDDISGNSSSTDRFKSTRDSKMAQDLQRQIYNDQIRDMAHGMPYSSEKKESWWFWKDSKKKKKQADDSCSCVSCAFKKIMSSDNVCVGCLVLVFALSLSVAVFVVYNSMSPSCKKPVGHVATSKNEMPKAKRQFRSDSETDDSLANKGRNNWKEFKDFVTNPWRSLPLAPETDFGDSNFRDANYVEESGNGLSIALSEVLEPEKLNDIQTSEKLRDFYKRLIQTDARIKKLKTKADTSNTFNTADGLNNIGVPKRFKRSLMSVSNPVYYETNSKATADEETVDLSKFKIYYPPYVAVRSEANKQRVRRNDEDIFDGEPSGIIIEKKKVMVQYAPFERKRNFPKCSHSPNQFKSHEKQLKHPFYRNSQRLDELLGQILDKNIDNVVANPLNLDVLLGDRDTCKHSKQDQELGTQLDDDLRKLDTLSTTKSYIDDVNQFTSVNNTDVNLDADSEANDILKLTDIRTENLDSDLKLGLVEKEVQGLVDREVQSGDDIRENEKYMYRSTTPRYDLLLSISTLINSNPDDIVKISRSKSDSKVKKRKILQLNEEGDDSLGYEDFKEVLADYTDTHDETDKRVEREKRSEDSKESKAKEFSGKYDIPQIYNQNWKGQMQLYPDELSFIMKPSTILNQNSQKSQNIKYDSPAVKEEKYENTDTEYVENNSGNKYAKLAQAYSDYGVFAGKKMFLSNEKSTYVTENDMFSQKFTDDEMSPRKGGTKKSKKRRNTDLPTSHHGTSKFEMKPFNSEHFSNGLKFFENNSSDNSYSNNSDLDKKLYNNKEEESEIIFPYYRIKRSLKSINIEKLKNREVKDENTVVRDKQNLDPNFINEIKRSEINETHVTQNDTLDGIGDILHIMSDWFMTLAKLSGELGNNSTLQVNNGTKILTLVTPKTGNVTKDIEYPMYDADMIDNIGHRSRSLLAIEENRNKMPSSTINKTAMIKDLISKESKLTNLSSNAYIANTTVAAIANKAMINASDNINKTLSNSDTQKNRTVSKRSADSNLIFWSDIYDDEYGIKVDYFNNEQRSKHSVDNENFVKRSGQWINRKFRKLGDRFRTKAKSKKYPTKTKRRILRSIDDLRSDSYLQSDQNQLYGAKPPEVSEKAEAIFDFETLTANMKQICHEAVKAVQKTRSINARQEISGEFEATSLMQQLVRLMTDLIDFQVQQKTCAKLPSDLAEFLNWLTSPNAKYPGEIKFEGLKIETTESPITFPKEDTPDTSMPHFDTSFIREGRDDPRMELVYTLRSVKDLLRKYEELSKSDQIKLTGVKEYLDNQMDFLVQQLSAYDYKIPPMTSNLFRKRRLPLRRKRQMKIEPGDVDILRKPPAGKHVNKFVKIYGVKRTKTTSSYFDSVATGNLRKKKHDGNNMNTSETPETSERTTVTKNVTKNVKT